MVPIEDVYRQIAEFAADAGAKQVLLFGSRARGDNRPKSDIDLAIRGCADFDALKTKLNDELWSLLKLDIVNMDEPISSELRDEIDRDGVVLYEQV